ncbi:hypothetical protein VNO77_29843 [Canavalia gladiata]|uniref:Uncharacterized protein n=1 Tax=Canavalia gladiata TaxID=3824 RepID=A0AAN9KQZ6_CANGL
MRSKKTTRRWDPGTNIMVLVSCSAELIILFLSNLMFGLHHALPIPTPNSNFQLLSYLYALSVSPHLHREEHAVIFIPKMSKAEITEDVQWLLASSRFKFYMNENMKKGHNISHIQNESLVSGDVRIMWSSTLMLEPAFTLQTAFDLKLLMGTICLSLLVQTSGKRILQR